MLIRDEYLLSMNGLRYNRYFGLVFLKINILVNKRTKLTTYFKLIY
jgi:hypothetical protein